MIPTLTPAVRFFLILHIAVWFVVQVVLEGFVLKSDVISASLALTPIRIINDFSVWQFVTYMFLHSLQVSHILFNMLILWFFGSELEERWGSKTWSLFYLGSGIGAGIFYFITVALLGNFTTFLSESMYAPVVGASGALFGLMLAYGITFGERPVAFMMVFPMKAKYFVMLMGIVQFSSLLTTRERGSDVAYLAHLGGLLAGYIIFKYMGWKQNRQQKTGGRSLRLVVNNEEKRRKNEPRYWN